MPEHVRAAFRRNVRALLTPNPGALVFTGEPRRTRSNGRLINNQATRVFVKSVKVKSLILRGFAGWEVLTKTRYFGTFSPALQYFCSANRTCYAPPCAAWRVSLLYGKAAPSAGRYFPAGLLPRLPLLAVLPSDKQPLPWPRWIKEYFSPPLVICIYIRI